MTSDAVEIADAFFQDSVSKAEIGRRYGLTRERIRQIVVEADASGVRRKERLERIAQEEAEARFVKQEAELLRRAETAQPCSVCGSWILRKAAVSDGAQPRSCSPDCAVIWRTGRYQLDPAEHAKHRVKMARAYLKKPEKYRTSQLIWAHKMVEGNPPLPNRRFRVPNSQASQAVDSIK